jgi:hypothetical protein
MDDRRLVRRFLACAILCGGVCGARAAAEDPRPALPGPRYEGRRVQDVIEELRSAGGLNLIYSSDLVRPEMAVKEEPRGKDGRALLDQILAPHGLQTRPGPGGVLVVVKRPPGPKAPAADALRLGFSDRADVPGTLDAARPENAGTLLLRTGDVLDTPGALDNVFRALQVLPGVTGAGLFETRIAVRGGAPDQNLTVMDGVEIHNPFRLFGAVAGFNPDTVGRFELVAGAFPARYGDRLSSLLVVETRDGRADVGLAGSVNVSATDASGLLEGRLPGPGGSWLFAGRRTYYDLVAERILGDDMPQFDDVQVKLAWHGARGQRLALTGWRSRERSDADWSDAVDKVVFASGGANDLLALDLQAPIGPHAFARIVLSAYRFDESLDLALAGRSDTRVSFVRPGDADDQILTLGLARNVGVRDLALRQDLAFHFGPRHQLEIGAEAHRLRTTWRQVLAGDRSAEVANGSSILFGAGLPDVVDSTFDHTRVAAFAQYRARIGSRLVVTGGLRLEHAGAGAEATLSPRLQALHDFGGGSWRLKAGAGLHVQSPGYEKLLHSDYFLDLSRRYRSTLAPERARHLVVGLERTIAPGLEASLEGYYRAFDDLVVGRLESPTELAARVALHDYPPALRWGIRGDPIITSVPVNGAAGEAWGVLATLSREDRPERTLSGWVSYAWGVALRSAYGRTYPFDYDRPHASTAVFRCRFSSRLELGVTGRVASGLPSTPPRGVLVLGAPDVADRDRDGNVEELLPARDERGRPIYVADPGGAGTLNSMRLPTYARFDARLTFKPRGPAGRWLFYAEVLNVLDRRNASSYDWDIRLDPGAARPHIEISDGQDGLPLVPTLGVRFRF